MPSFGVTVVVLAVLAGMGDSLGNDLGVISVSEPRDEASYCQDLNAEYRYDNASCVATCRKPSITENPGFCFGKPILLLACYCKQNFYLDETTNLCTILPECPCNSGNHEMSRFGNECSNNCATYHTLTDCSKALKNQCWCDPAYCKNDQGICVSKRLMKKLYKSNK